MFSDAQRRVLLRCSGQGKQGWAAALQACVVHAEKQAPGAQDHAECAGNQTPARTVGPPGLKLHFARRRVARDGRFRNVIHGNGGGIVSHGLSSFRMPERGAPSFTPAPRFRWNSEKRRRLPAVTQESSSCAAFCSYMSIITYWLYRFIVCTDSSRSAALPANESARFWNFFGISFATRSA